MPETSQSPLPGSNLDPTDYLPHSLLRSNTIPPNPTQSPSTIDWLPDFAGHSWIAYGASSLLVISHLPSPLSAVESRLAPFLRLVFHLPSTVSAVSWSPVTPSTGELAAASGHCIFLFSNYSATSTKGSFCWSQNAVLVQSTKVEAIKWAGSGDGLIVGGFDVVLWRRRNKSWEIAWKFKKEQLQTHVSATWSIGGCSASASCPSGVHAKESNNTNTHVMVCYGNGASEFASTELRHPQPVTMIQWRPLIGRQFKVDANLLSQNVLLTCCLDGTVRLWTEVDHGKVRKQGKEHNIDQKAIKRSFSVTAVIEINKALQGALGIDISLAWAIDIDGLCRTRDGISRFFSVEEHGNLRVGRCEWLVGLGPGALITFWAIHCLDDKLPVRFPRVTLWIKQQIQELESEQLHCSGFSKLEDNLLLSKVVILRSCPSAPPTVCSLIRLSRCSYLTRLVLEAETSINTLEKSSNQLKIDRYSASSASNIVNVGHSGEILQVAIHPDNCKVELAVSLDSNGLILFWSISKFADTELGLSTLIPTWENCGEFETRNSCSKYTCLKWAPSVKDNDRILLMGHAGGIDCFIVEICQNKKRMNCHHLCTIPLGHVDTLEDGPSDIFGVPLSSTCNQTFKYNNFMLLGLWSKGFRALSWEVTVHSYDSCGSCSTCSFYDNWAKEGYLWKFENNFSNRRYCLGVNVCSSQLPEPHSSDHVTSYSVISPDNLIPVQENPNFNIDLSCGFPAYVMATGCSDGSLKLWRSNSSKQSTDIPWELVGKFIAFEGPIHSICLAGSGQKIATICAGSHLRGGPSILRIWETLHFIGGGTFMLEDELYIDGDVVACKWLGLGNGQFLLGISLQNELHVYAKKHLDGFALISPVNNRNEQNWSCIAVSRTQSTNRDFVWGPRATAVVIHDNYFSLLSQLLGMVNDENQAKSCLQFVDKDYEVRKQTEPFSCHDDDITVLRESSSQNDLIGNWSIIEVVEKYKGALQVFHPKALIMNICSGNWKRAYVSVKHLVDFLIDASERKSGSEKCNCVPQVALSSYLEGFMQKDSTDKGFHWNADPRLSTSSAVSFIYNSNFDASSSMSGSSATKPEIAKFIDTLEKKYSLVGFDEEEKLQVLAIVDLLGELLHSSSAFQNLDEAGRRFWVKLRFQQLHYSKRFGRLPSVEEMVVDARLINWAFHSDCQETLWSSFLPSEPSWKQMQTLGVGFWFTNVVELRARMEKLARLQYLRKKDPKDCALLYIVLNRLQVLAGLFKLSKDEKDKPLVGFLLRNFQEEKNKAAALKNAYVLLGRHQIELAIAFFLLGGDTYSAVTVCVKNLGDEQLALVICSLIDGPGGSLEHQLITKVMLPSSIARGDYWITALLEWRLGNYYESILKMLGCHGSSAIYRYALSYNHLAFLDPHIGLYCLLLATKTSVKNAIGESAAAILGRWATVMAARAFASCGLFLEALECASSRTIPVSMDQRTFFSNNHSQILRDILKPTALDSFNWLSGDVALHLESFAKTDLALQYFSLLMKEHPRWYDTVASSSGYGTSYTDFGIQQDLKLVENFREKIRQGLANLEKFSVPSSHITQMMLIWLCNNGLCFLGYDITLDYSSHNSSLDIGLAVGGHILYPYQFKQVWKAVQDTYLLWSRFTISSCLSCFILSYKENDKDVSVELQAICSYNWNRYVQDILGVFSRLRASMRIIFSSLSEDISRILSILDLFEFYVHVASAWHLRDSEELLSVVQPFLINCTNGQTPYKVDLEKLKEIICQPKQLLGCQNSKDDARTRNNIIGYVLDSQDGHKTPSSADNEKWHVIGTCVWQRMEKLMKQVFHSLSINLEDSCLPDPSNNTISSLFSIPADAGGKSIKEQIEFFTMLLADLFKTTTMYISSYHLKMLGSFVQWKVVNGLQTPILEWLRESSVAHAKTPNQDASKGTAKSEDEKIVEILWNTCANPVLVSEGFAEEKISWSHLVDRKSSKSWNEIYKSMTAENKTEESIDNEVTISKNSLSNEDQTTSKGLFKNTRTFLSSWQKDVVISKEDSQFEIAKEIYKGEGELLAALCINSTNEQEGAIASSRKGIIFFSSEDWQPCRDQSNYIWSYADWPLNGWAGTQSTPVPTCVSPGVGLGSKKGAHLGLGGATIGVDSSARPFRDLTSGGALGIPGYAGIGASGLGWEVQDDFEEFIDPPATVENINTRAFSSHPSRPFFLVGSSNTHIYLWEFGKDRATATYGVLPAANVPPPYALASISALQFDHYGHRFATAALDGTVCTWQLEVGGRSNIHPTESSLCFNDHASDVTYIISSSSIIAAAGSSSNNLNVVIWDTLASATTSRIPIRCHEGGARSIAVFDNNIGSGSVSPLIVTGGKGGDVAVHDFRYVVTGKTKRLKHSGSSNGGGSSSSSNADMQTKAGISGEKNVDGMLWYLPKAHIGSVTKVSTIPHTSLFLTGSKDGDVKLWDAKAAKMVRHWPKLHERRTFLEPNTRGFGGVVRAAVTDIQVVSHGFLTCGADGSVKLVKLRDRSGTVP